MTGIAVLLIVISAFTHAGWNLLGKRRSPTSSFFLLANLVGAALLLPVIAAFAGRLSQVPARVWWLLLVTGFFQALYYTALAAAYRAGDMSVAYPVARSVPVVLTSLIVAASAGFRSFTLLYIAGCLLVIGGILLISARSAGAPAKGGRLPLACALLALLAAAGTTGYSIIDSAALALLRSEGRFSAAEAALLYLAVEAASSTAWMSGSVLIRRQGRAELAHALRSSWRPAALMGAGIYVTYGIVLVAMAFARNVGYIVAFRQLSVPLGALLAILLFREPAPPRRLAGIAAASAGLLLIALG